MITSKPTTLLTVKNRRSMYHIALVHETFKNSLVLQQVNNRSSGNREHYAYNSTVLFVLPAVGVNLRGLISNKAEARIHKHWIRSHVSLPASFLWQIELVFACHHAFSSCSTSCRTLLKRRKVKYISSVQTKHFHAVSLTFTAKRTFPLFR